VQSQLLHLLHLLLHLLFHGNFFLKQFCVKRALFRGVLRMQRRLLLRQLGSFQRGKRAAAFDVSYGLDSALQESPFGTVNGYDVILLN
jgi:hypothetical protein